MYGFGVSRFLSLLLTSPDCAYILLVQLPEGVVRDVVYWLGYRWCRLAVGFSGAVLLGYGGRTMTALLAIGSIVLVCLVQVVILVVLGVHRDHVSPLTREFWL